MSAQITELLTTPEAFELARDAIAQILEDESAGQQALATAQELDTEPYVLRIGTERTDVLSWVVVDTEDLDLSPFVNVWLESVDLSGGGHAARQPGRTKINVDCYGFGVSTDTEAGHDPPDYVAAQNAFRAARLCRQILCSEYYQFLGDLRPLVGSVWPEELRAQPAELNSSAGVFAHVVRLTINVTTNETSPAYVAEILETINAKALDPSTGEVLVDQTFEG